MIALAACIAMLAFLIEVAASYSVIIGSGWALFSSLSGIPIDALQLPIEAMARVSFIALPTIIAGGIGMIIGSVGAASVSTGENNRPGRDYTRNLIIFSTGGCIVSAAVAGFVAHMLSDIPAHLSFVVARTIAARIHPVVIVLATGIYATYLAFRLRASVIVR